MAIPTSSDPRLLLSVDDLDDGEISRILRRAREIDDGPTAPGSRAFVVALLFLSSSLRTRVGFSVAAMRLGGSAINLVELRGDASMSEGESFSDTVRTVGGMVDLIVTRTPFALDRGELRCSSVAPFVNGGDGRREHPTQALIDLYAMETEKGPVAELRVGICGDLGMRSVTSMLKLLSRFLPASLVLMGPKTRVSHDFLGPDLKARTIERPTLDPVGVDVLYMAGLPRGKDEDAINDADRSAFALTKQRLRSLPSDAVVLSPLPVVDEIDVDVRADRRVRMFEQSDSGVAVRMAILEHMLAGS